MDTLSNTSDVECHLPVFLRRTPIVSSHSTSTSSTSTPSEMNSEFAKLKSTVLSGAKIRRRIVSI